MKRHNNTPRKVKSKKETKSYDWGDYFCNISFKMKPINEASREKFSLDWVEKARKDPAYINIWEFPVIDVGISKQTVFEWMAKDKNVDNAHKYVRNICAIRRDKGAATRDLDGSYIAKTMPIYCDDYKALEEWRANLSEKIAGAGGFKIIEVPSFSKETE